MKAEFMTPRTKRQRDACQLLCGRTRAPNNPYRLCYTCLDRLYEISGDAKKRRRQLRDSADARVVQADPHLSSLYGEPAT